MKSYADKEPKRAPKITEEQQNTAAVQQKTAVGRPAEGSIAQLQAMVRSSRQAMQLKEMKALMQAGKRQAQAKDTAQLAGPLDEEELQFKSKEAVQKKGPLDEEELQFKAKDTAQLAGPLDEEELQFKSKEAVQKKGPLDEDELQFKKDETVQCKGPLDEEELQFKAEEPVQKQENRTGLPDNLKAGVEKLSGMAMDDVRVHYNSGKPAQLNAYAYTQGTEIHVAPGQEKHLPHEAWHVVQQKQGRVQPTMQMAGGVAVNDDNKLEREADVFGRKSLTTESSALDHAETHILDSRIIQKNGPRLRPNFQVPTAAEWDALTIKYNYVLNSVGETLERYALIQKTEIGNALNTLADLPEWCMSGPEPVKSSDLDNYKNNAIKNHYKGPTEVGHTIWIDFNSKVNDLFQEAFWSGYAVTRADVQMLLVKAALAITLLESDANGSAGRSETMRR